MDKRILIVEDDRSIATILRDTLRFEGFAVASSESGADALEQFRTFAPDLVLLDLMLPHGLDGLEVCRVLQQEKDPPAVIMITAKAQREERVRGLTAGADDYVVKPFALDELLARIRAVLRRTKPTASRVTLGEVEIDFRRLCGWKRGKELSLTDREFQVIRYLTEHAGAVVTRVELLTLVWGYSEHATSRTVDNFVFRLRQKLEPDPHHPRYIRTSYGDGYRFTPDGTAEE